ncbi:MAG: hypothetical protein ACXWKG_05120 [Limisphaerales bacterium]
MRQACCVLLVFSFAAFSRAAEKSLPRGVEAKQYTGWEECVFLNASETPVQAIVVPAIGGRIINFSYDNDNILFENAASAGRTVADNKGPFWASGYQCDIGPEIIHIPPHDQLWIGPNTWKALHDYNVSLSSQTDSNLGVAIDKQIVMAPDTGELGIVQRLRNESGSAKSYCLWDRSLCKGGGFAFFPLNKRSHFKSGWSVRARIENNYVYDSENPSLPQVHILNGVLVTETFGEPSKIGADSDAGWIAYVRGKLLFVKYFPFNRKGSYTDGGNSVEVYFDQRVAEIEPLSPETKLEPGQNFSFPEKWVLIPLKKEVTTVQQARELVKRIPPSPFK